MSIKKYYLMLLASLFLSGCAQLYIEYDDYQEQEHSIDEHIDEIMDRNIFFKRTYKSIAFEFEGDFDSNKSNAEKFNSLIYSKFQDAKLKKGNELLVKYSIKAFESKSMKRYQYNESHEVRDEEKWWYGSMYTLIRMSSEAIKHNSSNYKRESLLIMSFKYYHQTELIGEIEMIYDGDDLDFENTDKNYEGKVSDFDLLIDRLLETFSTYTKNYYIEYDEAGIENEIDRIFYLEKDTSSYENQRDDTVSKCVESEQRGKIMTSDSDNTKVNRKCEQKFDKHYRKSIGK